VEGGEGVVKNFRRVQARFSGNLSHSTRHRGFRLEEIRRRANPGLPVLRSLLSCFRASGDSCKARAAVMNGNMKFPSVSRDGRTIVARQLDDSPHASAFISR